MTPVYAVELAWSTVERPVFLRVPLRTYECAYAELFERFSDDGRHDWTGYVRKDGWHVLIRIAPVDPAAPTVDPMIARLDAAIADGSIYRMILAVDAKGVAT